MSKPSSPRFSVITNSLDGRYQSDLIRGIRGELGESADLLVSIQPNLASTNESLDDFLRRLPQSQSTDGLIVLSGTLGLRERDLTALVERFRSGDGNEIPVVSVGVSAARVHTIRVDDVTGLRAATRHLRVHHKLERIGFLGGPLESEEAKRRYEGYKAELGELLRAEYVVQNGDFTFQWGRRATLELLGSRPEVQAIIAANDEMARGALDAIDEMYADGVRPAVVGFDDTEFAAAVTPRLTTVRQPVEEEGRFAARTLMSLYRGERDLPVVLTLPTKLQIRESCGCGRIPDSRSTGSVRQLKAWIAQVVPERTTAMRLVHGIVAVYRQPHDAQTLRTFKLDAEAVFQDRMNLATSSDIGIWHHALTCIRDITFGSMKSSAPPVEWVSFWDNLSAKIVDRGSALALRTVGQRQRLRHMRVLLDPNIERDGQYVQLAAELAPLGIKHHCVSVEGWGSSHVKSDASLEVVACSDPKLLGRKVPDSDPTPGAELSRRTAIFAFRSQNLRGNMALDLGEPSSWALLGEVAELIANSFGAVLLEGRVSERSIQDNGERAVDKYSRISNMPPASRDLNEWRRIVDTELNHLGTLVPFSSASIQVVWGDERSLFVAHGFPVRAINRPLLRPITVDSLVSRIVRARKPLLLEDVRSDPDWTPNPATSDIQSWVGAPIFRSDVLVGLLTLDFKTGSSDLHQYQGYVEEFASHIAAALERVLPLVRERQISEVMSAVTKTIDVMAAQKLDPKGLMAAIVEQVALQLNCSHCAYFEAERRDGHRVLVLKQKSQGAPIGERTFRPGAGIAGLVYQTGVTLLLHDATHDSRFLPGTVSGTGRRSMLVVPVRTNRQIRGVISADQDAYAWFDQNDRRFVEALAQQAGIAIESARALERIQNVAAEILATNDTESVLNTVVKAAVQVTNATAGVVYLLSDDKQSVRTPARFPRDVDHPPPRLHEPNGITRRIVSSGKAEVIVNLRADPRLNTALLGRFESMAGVPLLVGTNVIGVLYVSDAETHEFVESEVALVATLARLAAFALQKSALVNERTTSEEDKSFYARFLTLEILPEISWLEFMRRIRVAHPQKEHDSNFIGPAAVLWTEYQLRRSVSRGDVQPTKGLEKSPYERLLLYVQDRCAFNTALVEATIICLDASNDQDEPVQAAVAVVGHAWRQVYRTSAQDVDQEPNAQNDVEWSALLRLTSLLLSRCLDTKGSDAPIHLGRETLRLYFGLLLCNADALRTRYLGMTGQHRGSHRQVPKAVRREFALNLSRFMMGAIGILERRNRIQEDGISPVESLDGLLYMIDRFVHVEIGVDERLDIRAHLGRGLVAEVKNHLARPHYRDHLIHVVDVFLLGYLLLSTEFNWLYDKSCTLADHMSQLVHRGVDKLHRDWAVTALLHDLGYQALANGEGSSTTRNFDGYFALPRGPRFGWLDLEPTAERTFVAAVDEFLTHVQSKTSRAWAANNGSFKLDDHGVLSALRLAQELAQADVEGTPDAGAVVTPLLEEYSAALHAIFHHNLMNHTVGFSAAPISCLLRLCDELQEWGRKRIDIEGMVKRLYLQIEEGERMAIPSDGSLAELYACVSFQAVEDRATGTYGVKTQLSGKLSKFQFWLYYSNPVVANYDAITTLLSKSYNLQHVELATPDTHGYTHLEWRICMCFPRPEDYRGLTEMDLYGVVRERIRVIPELWQFEKVEEPQPGMVRLLGATREEGGKEVEYDCVGIIIRGSANREHRHGWQTVDPNGLRRDIIGIKRKTLTGRVLGRDKWITGI